LGRCRPATRAGAQFADLFPSRVQNTNQEPAKTYLYNEMVFPDQQGLKEASEDSAPPKQHHQHLQIRGVDPKHKKGLRTVATIEFSKGVAAVLLAFGLLSLLHKDLWDVADSLLQFFHINPDHHFAQAFLDLADRVTDRQLWGFAGGAFAYSAIRFVEAYGLWRTRVWAEWLAILSGLIYLPYEIHGVIRKSTPFRWSVIFLNLALVSYVAYVRFSEERRRRQTRGV
jgi:uncharacterized membrane protein (DUF2068 family)